MHSTEKKAWRKEKTEHSLPEVYATVHVPEHAGFFRKLLAFTGPGLMVAVGYMDPGNWATDIAGGAQYGYTLLSVVLISNLFAIFLQHLSLKLGVVAERDLAQACRDHYPPWVSFMLWILCEVAIAACDLAEVIGSAIALNILFDIPLVWGVLITGLDVLIILFFQYKGFRLIESIVAGLIIIILLCFVFELLRSQPALAPMFRGLIPDPQIVKDPGMLYLAIGILGATVMPHNLYLHSAIVQTRDYARDHKGKKTALKFATIDSTVSLLLALFINGAILVVSAATFHHTGHRDVADITDAHALLTPLLGTTLASVLFAVALLASGQNSTLTGTLAGQIVMEGFLQIRLKPWLRRLVTRLLAIIPALIVTALYGEKGTTSLLVLSQVILSMQLSFAVVPLVVFTGSGAKMGEFANPQWMKALAWIITLIIIALNGYLLYQTLFL